MLKRPLAALCALLAVSFLASAPQSAQELPPPVQRPDVQVEPPLSASQRVRVIVGVRAPFVPEGELASAQAIGLQRSALRAAQAGVLNRLRGLNVAAAHAFETIPFIAMEVDGSALAALANMPDVESVVEDTVDFPTLAQSTPLIEATTAWSRGYTGSGWAVAILDTGVDKAHPMFPGGKIVAEACYSLEGRCPGGVTASTEVGSGVPCTFSSSCSHGTHVAGIAAGKSSTLSGVAPDAAVIAMQIFSGSSSGAYTYTSDQIKGLERVLALHNSGMKIASANMSLGGGLFSSYCDSSNTSRKAAIDNLRSVGIATVIASGNDGSPTSISAPACISTAISVGSTAKNDAVSEFSNSADFLHLLAPGSSIQSAIPGGGYAFFSGTSMATPHVAGAWAILRQGRPDATVTDILEAFAATGKPVGDWRAASGFRTKPRINVNAALDFTGGRAEITSPVPGSTLPGPSVTFQWSAGAGDVSEYYLYVGSSAGAYDIYEGAQGTNRQRTISNLPTDGRTIHVRLWSRIGGTYYPRDHQFIAAATILPKITSPPTGTSLTSDTVTFAWDAGSNVNVTGYYLYVGTTAGGYELYEGPQGLNRSKTVSGLPTNGAALWVTLWSQIDGVYQKREHVYFAVDGRAMITSPAPGSTLPGASATFEWSSGVGASAYYLYVGSSLGTFDIYEGPQGANRSRTVTNLPVDGRSIYVRLWSQISGTYHSRDFVFTAANGLAAITSPAPGSTLSGATVTFQWTSGIGVSEYYLYVGSTAGSYDLYFGSQGTNRSRTFTDLPIDGRTLYVRLWSKIDGTFRPRDYQFTAASIGPIPARMTSPVPGSRLTSGSTFFQWDKGQEVAEYYIYVGTTEGGRELWWEGRGTTQYAAVGNLPVDDSTIHVTLWSRIGSEYQPRYYTYTAAGLSAALTGPTPGSTLTGSSATFQWTAGTDATSYYLSVGSTPGGYDLYEAHQGLNRSVTISNLPTDGRVLYVRLQTKIAGAFHARDFTYTAHTQ